MDRPSNAASTKMVAAWKSDTLKRPCLTQPQKLLGGKADVRIGTATLSATYHWFL
jgi:hypothetical protein